MTKNSANLHEHIFILFYYWYFYFLIAFQNIKETFVDVEAVKCQPTLHT